MTHLIIARHGNTFAAGEEVRRVGRTDIPLTTRGLEQGRLLGAHLLQKKLLPDVLFTSTLQRTQQTANQAQVSMGINLPLNKLTLFDEIDYGPDENQPEAWVQKRIGEEAIRLWETQAIVPADWRAEPAQIIASWLDFGKKITHEYPHKIVLVVTSNGIARFAPHLTGDYASFCREHSIKLATGCYGHLEFDAEQKNWQCLAWNVKPEET